MHNLIAPFILEKYEAGEHSGRFSAAALFVDIGGFSRLTDDLMQHGQHGGEVLATVMNDVFAPLVESVYEQGGFICTFAGDAFAAVFPNSPLSALAVAWAMQQAMQAAADHHTPYGRFSITAKVGAAWGEVAWGIITSKAGRRASYYFQGTAIDGCTAAEKAAAAGDVILDDALYELVRDSVTVEAADSYHRVLATTSALPPPQPINLPPADPELVSHFFPPAVTHGSYSGEFRRVISVFISLPSVRTEAQLTLFMDTVFALQDRYGGLLNRLDFGDKGAHLLLFWGAPITYENDVQRALHFILDLQTQTAIPINGGITYRIAHAGYIGSPLHAEYTCYGRGVNLAARFMSRAPRGEIWLDDQAAQRAQSQFELEYEGEKQFKGFAQSQKVYVLLERKEAADRLYKGQMLGREAELERLAAFVEPIFHGRHPGMFLVKGEPGIGKSRLVHDFVEQLQPPPAAPYTTFSVFLCQTDEILRHSLNPFRYWLKHYFSVSDAVVEARNKRSFNRRLDDLIARTNEQRLADELDRLRSCLGAMVGLYWPDSLYELLDARSRHENTVTALITLIQAESRQRPVLLIWEDAHWSDEDSKALIPSLLRNLSGYPLAVLATARLEGAGLPLEGITFEEIELGSLNRSALATLAAGHLGGPAGSGLLELLAERADGNPFFAEQMVRYLQETQLVTETAGGWQLSTTDRLHLPANVQAVLIARLDRLTQEVRDVVQTAAVLGREFEVRLLSRMLHNEATLADKLARAEQESIWTALSEIHYIFRHAILREAAYQMQLQARRQALHALALQSLETLHADRLSLYYGEMAYHALAAQQYEPAFSHSLAAGDVATETFALQDAIAHYDNARQLVLQRQVSEVDSAIIRHLYERRGRVLELSNRYDEAQANYQEMLVLAETSNNLALKQAALIAQCIIHTTHTPLFNAAKARELGQAAMTLIPETGNRELEARSLWGMMLVEFHAGGDSREVFSYGEQSLAISRELQLKDQMGFLLSSLTWAYILQMQLGAARRANEEALSIWRQLGNLPMLTDTHALHLVILWVSGDYEGLLASAPEALRLSQSIGNAGQGRETLRLIGEIHCLQGRFGQAVANFEAAMEVSKLGGYDPAIEHGHYVRMTSLYRRCAALDQAEVWADRLYDLREGFEPVFAAYYLAAIAQAKIAKGDLVAGATILEEAFEPFNREGSAAYAIVPLSVADGHLQLALGNPQATLDRMRDVIETLRAGDSNFYLAESLWLQAKALLAMGQVDRAKEALLEAREVAEAIGERSSHWQILVTMIEVETMSDDLPMAETHKQQLRQVVSYISDQAGSDDIRAAFLAQPALSRILDES